jgi:hypothetical protein
MVGRKRVAVGARKVAEVDFGDFGFVVGKDAEFLHVDGEGAEEEIAGVGHDGGTARGDAVFGLEDEEFREEFVDRLGVGEFDGIACEDGAEVGDFGGLGWEWRVAEAEIGVRVGCGEAAASAVVEFVLTTGDGAGAIGVSGFAGFGVHGLTLSEKLKWCEGVCHPPGICMSIKTKGLRDEAFG